MNSHWSISIKLTLITLLLFGVGYPLFITAVAYIIGPNHGKGKIIQLEGKTIGFERIGQHFNQDQYFNGRPSAVNYNAAATGGSNKGPSNPEYLQQVQARIDTFLVHNPAVKREEIPVDLVTSSGGGLDPHISQQAANIQVPRIAHARNLDESTIFALIEANTEYPVIHSAPAVVHVLKLNLALDQVK